MRIAVAVVICAVSSVGFSMSAHAAAKARFVIEGLANCTSPPVHAYPIHIEGVGNLSADRTATLSVSGNVENTNYTAKLGGRPAAAEAGSASLNVTGKNSLRAVRDYPNNQLVIDLKVVGNNCSIRINHRLKPGKQQYTFMTAIGLAYCDKPQTVSATCSPQ